MSVGSSSQGSQSAQPYDPASRNPGDLEAVRADLRSFVPGGASDEKLRTDADALFVSAYSAHNSALGDAAGLIAQDVLFNTVDAQKALSTLDGLARSTPPAAPAPAAPSTPPPAPGDAAVSVGIPGASSMQQTPSMPAGAADSGDGGGYGGSDFALERIGLELEVVRLQIKEQQLEARNARTYGGSGSPWGGGEPEICDGFGGFAGFDASPEYDASQNGSEQAF